MKRFVAKVLLVVVIATAGACADDGTVVAPTPKGDEVVGGPRYLDVRQSSSEGTLPRLGVEGLQQQLARGPAVAVITLKESATSVDRGVGGRRAAVSGSTVKTAVLGLHARGFEV